MRDQTSLSENFVKPSPKPELSGEQGLYAEEIAASIGVPAKRVREKLGSRGFLDRIEKLGFLGVAFVDVNDSNGLEFTNYALNLSAAKFFVAKWNNNLGDAYLGFLIRLEEGVGQFERLANKDPLLSNILHCAKLRKNQIEQADQIENMNVQLSDFSVASSPAVNQRLVQAIKNKADASGGPKLIPFIRDLLIHIFGYGDSSARLQDQIRISQLADVEELLEFYTIPIGIVRKYYPIKADGYE